MTSTRRAVTVLVLALVALAGVVAVRPPHAPPLYDGLGFPDEPYRWISLPPGVTSAATQPASTLNAVVDVAATQAQSGFSAEQGPQVAISVSPGALVVPEGTTQVTITATPEAAPPPPPAGALTSNLYRWTVTADRPGPVTIGPDAPVYINLRADVATTQAVVVQRWTGKAWEQVTTRQVGMDIYAARITDFSPIALIKLDRGLVPSADASAGGATAGATAAATPGAAAGAGTSPQQQASGSGPGAGLWIGGGAVVLVLAVGLLLARRWSRMLGDDDASGADVRDGGTP